MAINNVIKRLLWLLSTSFLCSSSCIKNIGRDCTRTLYSFELPFTARPDKDSIKVGDEIVFKVDCSTTFTDFQTGKQIDYSGAANLGRSISFGKFDSSGTTLSYAANQFSYNLIKGTPIKPVDSSMNREYLFIESNGRYEFELAIKPKTPELYMVAFSNSANTYRQSDPCGKAGFSINLTGTNHNRYLKGSSDEIVEGGDIYFFVSP